MRRPTVAQFLRQCWRELQKTSWPTERSLARNSLIVFTVVVAVVATLGVLEIVLGQLVQGILT